MYTTVNLVARAQGRKENRLEERSGVYGVGFGSKNGCVP